MSDLRRLQSVRGLDGPPGWDSIGLLTSLAARPLGYRMQPGGDAGWTGWLSLAGRAAGWGPMCMMEAMGGWVGVVTGERGTGWPAGSSLAGDRKHAGMGGAGKGD